MPAYLPKLFDGRGGRSANNDFLLERTLVDEQGQRFMTIVKRIQLKDVALKAVVGQDHFVLGNGAIFSLCCSRIS